MKERDIYVEEGGKRHTLFDFLDYYCDDAAFLNPAAITQDALNLLSCMLNGDSVIRKDSELFADRKDRWTIYGQPMTTAQVEQLEMLVDLGLAADMWTKEYEGPSPAITQYRVTAEGFWVFKMYRKLREELYADA
jgi:hypothetical protein